MIPSGLSGWFASCDPSPAGNLRNDKRPDQIARSGHRSRSVLQWQNSTAWDHVDKHWHKIEDAQAYRDGVKAHRKKMIGRRLYGGLLECALGGHELLIHARAEIRVGQRV